MRQLDGRIVIGGQTPCVTRQWMSTGTAIGELRVWRASARVIPVAQCPCRRSGGAFGANKDSASGHTPVVTLRLGGCILSTTASAIGTWPADDNLSPFRPRSG